ERCQRWRGNATPASLREVAKPRGARCGQKERQEVQGVAFGFGQRNRPAEWPSCWRKVTEACGFQRVPDATRIFADSAANYRSHPLLRFGIGCQCARRQKRKTNNSKGYALRVWHDPPR